MTVIKPRIAFADARRAQVPTASSERTWARRYRQHLMLTDTAIVLASTIGAMFLRFGFDDTATPVAGFPTDYLTLSLFIALTWLGMLSLFHTRDPRVIGVGLGEYKRVVNATALTFGLLAILFLIAKIDIARGYFVVALPAGMVCVLTSRWLWRQWLTRQRLHDHYLSRALVVGGIRDVDYVVKQIDQASGAAYKVVGVSLDTGKRTGAKKEAALTGSIATTTREVPIVSDLDGVAQAASRLGADTVIVAGSALGGAEYVRRLSWKLEGTATDLVLASPLTDVAGPRIRFRPVEGLPLIQVEIPQFEGGKHLMKRAFDICSSAFGLLLISPLLLIIAALIKLDDGGPVFFSQERVGRRGETFRMYKFRSMVVDAEARRAELASLDEGNGVLFKMKNDPRITRLGAVLRKFSLDELPQLFNVLLGDMSLVGPRPPLESEVKGYANHVHRRLFIKPGLTGMWQVNGRSDLSWDESVRLDLYYVENWSLLGDLVIIWRTIRVIAHPAGAY
ncbi:MULTISPECIES: sugar transferase [Leifsonia]|uniref:Exopolysaccharide biosynthesis polyprenyl glycosylphosphotransferase n=1 Tax=Leifsonia naganoensis TaxID=150025 RepID=A0A853DS41_9MICO|nr:sugar transferase [Leifsonia naganoensis]NYK10473.1 exopolysaccharide biosynthesis polyprenyl glycosylphosphotransferase [Leifsonia naganoensis]